jgi:aurora kinase
MKIHLYCSHPNILPAYGYHIGRDEVYLVMEYGFCNLYQEILRKGPFTEEKTGNYIRQILLGVEYLHRNGIIHRDLKPENVICLGDHLKITDFGWSIKTDKQRRTLCGTLDYISPEVAERNFYDNKIDCWSIGVLMYEMLTVQPPFSQEGHRYDFGAIVLPEHLSKDCCDLMLGLLKIDPSQRLSARQALDHSWIKNHNKNYLLFQRRQVRQLEF